MSHAVRALCADGSCSPAMIASIVIAVLILVLVVIGIILLTREPKRCYICQADDEPLALAALMPLLPGESVQLIRCCPRCLSLLENRARFAHSAPKPRSVAR